MNGFEVATRPLLDWADDMRRLFDDFGWPGAGAYPPVDVQVTGDEVVLTAELPGVRREDLAIEVEGQHMTLRGEKLEPQRAETDVPVHRERRFGKFERTFELGFDVDRDKIAAAFNAGVLTIRLPKAEAAKPRRIEVQGA